MSACDLGYLIRLLNRNRIPHDLQQRIDGCWHITHNRTTFVYSLEGRALDVPDISHMMEIEMKDDEMAEAFFAGKIPAFDDELAAVREEGEKIAMYAQLRFHALSMKRKQGWAAYFFKETYGHWPNREWEKVPPMRPTENTMALIEARDRRFVFEQKTKRQKEERAADEQRMGSCEASDALSEGAEGVGAGEHSGRVHGMGEDGGDDGELCPPDE